MVESTEKEKLYYCKPNQNAIAKQTEENWISLLITVVIMCGFGFIFIWSMKNMDFIKSNSMLIGVVISILWIIVLVMSGIQTFKKTQKNSNQKYNFEILLSTVGFAIYTVFLYLKVNEII